MTRLTTVAACLAASALSTTAYAQSQAEIAEKLNAEGKTLLFSNKYAEASAKFRLAVARVPEPGYFINLCTSLYHEGKFGEALTACNAVSNNNPSADQRGKSDKLVARIKQEAQAQGISVEALGGGQSPGDPGLDCGATPGDPRCEQPAQPDLCKTNPQDPSCGGEGPNGTPQPQPQPQYVVGRPPSGTGLFASTTPDNQYTWTLGVEGFFAGGTIGADNFYGSTAGGLRLKGDYLLNPATRLGAQAYVQFTQFERGEMDASNVESLLIADVGIAGYKHLCPRSAQRLCLTPLAGVQLAMMGPESDMTSTGEQFFNYAAVGGRLELGAHYAFGSRFEHVLGVTVGVNLYSRVIAGPDEFSDSLSIVDAGLDKGGAAGYFGLGYTYRFRTPLGSAPFITLE
jgi:hypothetical protein